METSYFYRDEAVKSKFKEFFFLVFDSQAAIRSLPGFVNNSRIVRDCRSSLDLLSERLNTVSLVWVPGHGAIPGNCRADELARADALLPEFSSVELCMRPATVKLDIERKFFRDVNLNSVNEESCSIARFTWSLMDKRRTNQLLGLSRDVILTTVAVLTGHCVMRRHAERMRIAFNDFCRECRSTEKEETVVHFLYQCPSLARHKYRLFGSSFLVSLTELSSLDIKAGFPAWGNRALMFSPCADQPPSLFRFWRNLVSTETVFSCGFTTGCYGRSSELCCSTSST